MSSPLTPIAACRQPQNRHACQLEIRSPGLQVTTVTDHVSLAREKRPELVVVDIRIPPTRTTEGLDTARVIHEELSDIGILVLSGHVEIGHAMADRISRVGDSSICVLSPSARSTANGSATLRAARHHPRASLHTSPASTATSARSTAPPRHAHAVHRPHRLPLHRCTGGRVRHHRPLRRADDARIIAPRATELHALRSAIPTRHTVMMGPWVPPPTSRAPAVPNNVGNTGPHSAGSRTEYRPRWPADGRTSPTPWMG